VPSRCPDHYPTTEKDDHGKGQLMLEAFFLGSKSPKSKRKFFKGFFP
jgi:hypothetical protein